MELHWALERWALPEAALFPLMVITDCCTQGLWFWGVLMGKECLNLGTRSEELSPRRQVSWEQSSLSLPVDSEGMAGLYLKGPKDAVLGGRGSGFQTIWLATHA